MPMRAAATTARIEITKATPNRIGSGRRKPVHPRRSATVERRLFRRRRPGCDALERVPQLGVPAGLLVGREVALEHAAVNAKSFDAGLDILAPCGGEFFGRRRNVASVKVETERGHADAAELDVDGRAFRQFADVLAPAGEYLLTAAGIGADAKHTTDMSEDYRRVREGAGAAERV